MVRWTVHFYLYSMCFVSNREKLTSLLARAASTTATNFSSWSMDGASNSTTGRNTWLNPAVTNIYYIHSFYRQEHVAQSCSDKHILHTQLLQAGTCGSILQWQTYSFYRQEHMLQSCRTNIYYIHSFYRQEHVAQSCSDKHILHTQLLQAGTCGSILQWQTYTTYTASTGRNMRLNMTNIYYIHSFYRQEHVAQSCSDKHTTYTASTGRNTWLNPAVTNIYYIHSFYRQEHMAQSCSDKHILHTQLLQAGTRGSSCSDKHILHTQLLQEHVAQSCSDKHILHTQLLQAGTRGFNPAAGTCGSTVTNILHTQLLQAGTRGSILQSILLQGTNIYYIHSFYRQEHVAQSCWDKHILRTQLLQAGTRGSILQWQTYTTYTASTGRNTWLNPAVTNIYYIHSFYRQEDVAQSCSDKHILYTQLLQAGTRGSILQWQTYTTYTASTGRNMWFNPAVTNIYYIHSFYRQEHVAQSCSDKHILHTQLLQAGTCGSILQWQTYTTYTASTGRNMWLNPAVTNIYYIHSFYRQEHVAQSCSDKHILHTQLLQAGRRGSIMQWQTYTIHTQLLQAGTCGSIMQWQTYTTYTAFTGRKWNTWLNPAVTNIYYIHSFYRQKHVAQSCSDKHILHTQLLQAGTRGSILRGQTYTTYTASTGRKTWLNPAVTNIYYIHSFYRQEHVVQSCRDKHILHTQLLQAGRRGSILQWQTYTTYTASTGRNTWLNPAVTNIYYIHSFYRQEHVVQSCSDKHILHTQLLQAGTCGSILQGQTYTTYTASTGRNMWLNPAVTNIYYIHSFYRQEHVAQSCSDKHILHTQLLQAGTRGSILQGQIYTTYTASTGRNTWFNPAVTNIYYIHSFYRQEHVAQSCRDKHILHTQLLQAGTHVWFNPAVTKIYYIHSFYRQEHVAQSCSDKHILHTQLLQAGTCGSILQWQTYTTYTASTGRNTWLNHAVTNIYYIHSFYRQEHMAQSCSDKHILHTQLLQAGTRGSIMQWQTHTTYTASTGRNTWLNHAVTNIYYIHSFYRQEHVVQSCSDKHILHTQLLQAGTCGSILQWQTYYIHSFYRQEHVAQSCSDKHILHTQLLQAGTCGSILQWQTYYIHSFYRQEHMAQSCSDKHILHTQLLQAGTHGSILQWQTYTTYTASTGRNTWLNPAVTNIYYIHIFYRQEDVAQSCSDKHILYTQLLQAGTRGSILQWQTYTTYTASTGRNTWLNPAVTNIYYIYSIYRQEHVAQSCSDKHILHTQLLQAGTRGSILQWQTYTTYTASTGRNMWFNPAVTNIYYIHSFYKQEHVAQSCSDKHILHTQLLQAGRRGSIMQWQTYTIHTQLLQAGTCGSIMQWQTYYIHSFYRQEVEHVAQSCSDKYILHTQLLQAETRGSILQWQTYTT